MKKLKHLSLLLITVILLCAMTGCAGKKETNPPAQVETAQQTQETKPTQETAKTPDVTEQQTAAISQASFDYSQIPPYTEFPYAEVNNNIPYFTEDEITTEDFEEYAPLDSLGRCGPAIACLGPDTLPTQKRQSISHVKPTGWHTVKYPEYITDTYLYNRCHLIAHELAGEDDNKQNLVTGTRYMNVTGMLPFENNTAYYLKTTGNHVMYRVTPIFIDNELVCRGVLMEGLSVEDNGASIQFCVFCYNVQPFITIDYATGESQVAQSAPIIIDSPPVVSTQSYILNTRSKKIHTTDCPLADKISEQNKETTSENIQSLMSNGYEPCKSCQPDKGESS